MSLLPEVIYRLIAIKIPKSLKSLSKFQWDFCKIRTKYYMKSQRTLNIKKKSLKMNSVEGLRLSDLKTHCKARIIKIVWYWHKDIKTNRTE